MPLPLDGAQLGPRLPFLESFEVYGQVPEKTLIPSAMVPEIVTRQHAAQAVAAAPLPEQGASSAHLPPALSCRFESYAQAALFLEPVASLLYLGSSLPSSLIFPLLY